MSATKKTTSRSKKHPKPKPPTSSPNPPTGRIGVPRGSGVLKGIAVRGGVFPPKQAGGQPHFHVHISTSVGGDYDIAVNILSQDNSEVLYALNQTFQPPNPSALRAVNQGFRRLSSSPDDLGLDYVAQKLVKRNQMTLLPKGLSTGEGDLHDGISDLVKRAVAAKAEVYAFGMGFGNPSANPIFKFKPDYGIHDIHMNQGNPIGGGHARDNGRYHDGALLVFFPSDQHWEALFIAFQTQSWDNDEAGNPR